jgi:hypothetical protein
MIEPDKNQNDFEIKPELVIEAKKYITETMELNHSSVKKFYDTFKPNFIGVFKNVIDSNSKFEVKPIDSGRYVHKYEDFLEICEKYRSSDYTIYSCYRKLKPGMSSRDQNDVIFHRYFFVDIDDINEEHKF